MYTVLIKETSTSSAVAVSRLSDMDQAVSFAYQLHQLASCKHFIVVKDDDVVVASFLRQNSVTLPAPAKTQEPAEEKKTFGLRKRNS